MLEPSRWKPSGVSPNLTTASPGQEFLQVKLAVTNGDRHTAAAIEDLAFWNAELVLAVPRSWVSFESAEVEGESCDRPEYPAGTCVVPGAAFDTGHHSVNDGHLEVIEPGETVELRVYSAPVTIPADPDLSAVALYYRTPVPIEVIPIPVAVPAPWDYVALGDSFATGFGSNVSYPALFASAVEQDTGHTVNLDNRAVNGQTSDGLLESLLTNDELRAAVAGAEIITWNIGLNDLADDRNSFLAQTCGGADGQQCLRQAAVRLAQNWERIFIEIASLRRPDDALVRVVTSYHPFVADDLAGGASGVINPLLRGLEATLADLADRFAVARADAYTAFNGPDGRVDPIAVGLIDTMVFHPTAAGQQVTADVLRALGYEPLAP